MELEHKKFKHLLPLPVTLISTCDSKGRVQEAVGWMEARKEDEVSRENYIIILGKVVAAEMNDRFMIGEELDELPVTLLFPYFRALGDPVARRNDFDV